jgi:cell division protein FtsQ
VRINWKKSLLVTVDIVLAVYLLCAFTVFNKPDETARVCTKAKIVVADESSNGFINANEITKRLKSAGLYPLGKLMRDINAREIEEKLKKSPFVKTAQCYKTEDGEVNVSITQLLPVIRVKADNGDDYYLDDKDCIMPNSLYTSDLIIATGNIPRWFARRYISPLGKAIMGNDMWKNLVVQVNVLPDRSIEIVPRVGDHIVHLGPLPEANSKEKRQELINQFVDRKLTRLEKFYKYGLAQAGWNKYSYIDIEFDNQIICRKTKETALADKAALMAIDRAPSSVQKQIEEQQATMLTESKPRNVIPAPANGQQPAEAKKTDAKKANVKKADSKKTEAKTKEEKKAEEKRAKAEAKKAKAEAKKAKAEAKKAKAEAKRLKKQKEEQEKKAEKKKADKAKADKADKAKAKKAKA